MTSGTDLAEGTTADSTCRLAEVLRREFSRLHSGHPKNEDTGLVTRQQPVADPSLGELESSSPQAHIDVRNADTLSSLCDEIHKLSGDGRTALCLSGGGVRSAAFNLGVLQGLARLGLRDRFHYVSTVSGGGYIGCWLSAWRSRSKNGIADVVRGLSWPDQIDDAEVSRQVPSAISNLLTIGASDLIGGGDLIYVVNGQWGTDVSVFPAGASGDVAPLAKLSGSATLVSAATIAIGRRWESKLLRWLLHLWPWTRFFSRVRRLLQRFHLFPAQTLARDDYGTMTRLLGRPYLADYACMTISEAKSGAMDATTARTCLLARWTDRMPRQLGGSAGMAMNGHPTVQTADIPLISTERLGAISRL